MTTLVGVTVGCGAVGAQASHPAALQGQRVTGQLVAEAQMIDVGSTDTSNHTEHLNVILPVRLQGHAASVILDTGSPYNFLDDATMQAWHVPGHAAQPWTLDTLTVGTGTEHDLPVQGASITSTLPGVAPVIGLLGIPVLAHYDVVFDGPARRVRLYRPPPGDTTWLPAGAVPAQCVPMFPPFGEGRIRFPLQVNGHTVPGMFDAGAQATVMNLAAAKAAGLTHHTPHVDRVSGPVPYANFVAEKRYVWHAPPVQLAATAVGADVVVLNTYDILDPPSGQLPIVALGLGALHDRVLVMSFSTHRVCLEPAKK